MKNDNNLHQPTPQPPFDDASAPPAGDNELATSAGDLASETVEQAQRLGSAARERILREADGKKSILSRKLDDLAQTIDDVGARAGGEAEDLQKKIVDRAVRAVRGASRALDENSTEELLRAAGRRIRERPGLFLAGCLALGFIGGRMLKR